MKRLLLIAALLPVPASLAQETIELPEGAEVVNEGIAVQSVTYTCSDGRIVELAYPDAQTAVLTIDAGEPLGLSLAPSDPAEAEAEAEAVATVAARYVGETVQWSSQAPTEGTLSALAAGETEATDPGVACIALPEEAGEAAGG